MRILHVIESLGRGGAERALANLVPALQALGHTCDVAALWGPYDLAADLEQLGCTVYRLDVNHRWNFLSGVARVRKLAAGRYDVVHAHLYFAGLYAGAVPGVACAKVMSFHNLAYDLYPPDTIHRKAVRALASWSANRCFDGNVAVSSAVARHVQHHLRLAEVPVIPNAFPLQSIAPRRDFDRRGVLARFGSDDRQTVIVAVGRLSPEKGHTYLIDAAAELVSHGLSPRVLIVGSGAEERSLRAQIARLELSQVVSIHPAVSHGDAMEILQAADVCVVSSLSEGFPLVPAEAMALETAVVATDVGGMRDLIEEGRTGLLVPSRDAVALAGAILRLCGDPALRHQLGTAGRARMLQYFDTGPIAARWSAYYEGLVARRARGTPRPRDLVAYDGANRVRTPDSLA